MSHLVFPQKNNLFAGRTFSGSGGLRSRRGLPNRAQTSDPSIPGSGFPAVCAGTAIVWFDQQPVFGHAADDGRWTHPSHDCGRDMVPVPPEQGREAKWSSTVDSRSQSLAAASANSRGFS